MSIQTYHKMEVAQKKALESQLRLMDGGEKLAMVIAVASVITLAVMGYFGAHHVDFLLTLAGTTGGAAITVLALQKGRKSLKEKHQITQETSGMRFSFKNFLQEYNAHQEALHRNFDAVYIKKKT